MFRVRLRVGRNRFPQFRIFPVRVGGEHIQAGSQILFQPGRKPERIDIGAEARDFFLRNAVKLFNFFKITSVKRSIFCHRRLLSGTMRKAGGTIFPFNGPEAHNVLRNPGR